MKAVRKLTNMGTDVRQIAKLLQKKAPPGHKLAYINEEEAQLLKDRGGSGRITPEGIPSYELEDSLQIAGASPATEPAQAPVISTPPSEKITPTNNVGTQPLSPGVSDFGQGPALGTGAYGTGADTFTAPQFGGMQQIPGTTQATQPLGTLGSGAFGAVSPTDLTPVLQVQPAPEVSTFGQPKPAEQASYTDKLGKYLSSPDFAVRGASGLAQALIAANQANKARQSAQQAKTETQALATPYQQQGQQLQQAAQRGELNAQGQQAIQAAQAQAAQSVATRGGVGGLQASQQIENMRQSLLQNQMNLGLQLQQVGDKIAQGAIQAGVQADQYINTLTANYAANIARTVAGTPSTTTTTTTGVA
jgi:hypothetical protein